MQINTIKNFYGIKSINHLDLIEKDNNTLIYAPNGVMKSSLAKSFNKISDGELPKDVVTDQTGKFSIEFGGVEYTDQNLNKLNKPNIIVFSHGLAEEMQINKSQVVPATTKSLAIQLQNLQKEMARITDEYYGILYSLMFDKQLKANDIILNSLIEVEDKESLTLVDISKSKDNYMSIEDEMLLNEKMLEIFTLNSKIIFNDEIKKLTKDELFEKEIDIYEQIISKKYSDNIKKYLSDDFTLKEFEELNKLLSKNGFYQAGHGLYLHGNAYLSDDINELINAMSDEIYGSEEAKKQYSKINALLTSNAKKRELSVLLNKEKEIIKEFKNYELLKFKFMGTLFKKNEKEFDKIFEDADQLSKKFTDLQDKLLKDTQTWKEVANVFNDRFYDIPYLVNIGEIHDDKMNIRFPVINKISKLNADEISDQYYEVFSTGEKRTLHMLELIFKIESFKRESDEQIFVVLDDVADSFDYKNKYAIIQYVIELSRDPRLRLLVLTHNIDFYRALALQCNRNDMKLLLSYKSNITDLSGNEIELYSCNEEYFRGKEFFNMWKNEDKGISKIALIPMIRNLTQYHKNSKSEQYKIMTKYLHYDKTTESLTTKEFVEILDEYNVKNHEALCDSGIPKNYIQLLINLSKEILSEEIVETDIREKIAISVISRVLTDKFIYDKYSLEFDELPENRNANTDNETSGNMEWFNRLKNEGKLSENEISTLVRSFVMAPSFVHVNGFMIEPLIDVGAQSLKNNLTDILRINNLYI